MQIKHLRANENPPSGRQHVTVTRDSSGADASEGSIVEHEGGVTFYVPSGATEGQVNTVMARAEDWAVQAGVQTIYVQD